MGRAEDLFALITDRGEPAIDEFISESQSEELFLDFKRSASNGAGKRLTDHDRNNLGRAISGFGNSEGGLIVWGVDCRSDEREGDVAFETFPLQKPRRFKSWLESAVSGLTIPAHPNVRHATLSADDAAEGFVVTFIAKSHLAPHQCIRPPQYYMRAGSNFMPVPHAVLAGMFGRRPHPVIFHMWQALPAVLLQNGVARFEIGMLMTNRSSAIARDAYLSVTIVPPSEACAITTNASNDGNWSGNHVFGCITQLVAHDRFKLAPLQITQPLKIVFELRPPFHKNLTINITLGCAGSPINEFVHVLPPTKLQSFYEQFRDSYSDISARYDFVYRVVGAQQSDDVGGVYRETF